MTIYLIWLDDKRCLFCADEATFQVAASVELPAGKASGARGFIANRLEPWKTSWRADQSGVVSWMRRAWEWLHTWTRPDEPMLARLWSSPGLLIRHPAKLAPDELHEIWSRYLRGQFHRHLFWMAINGLLAPPSLIFLWPLPGPNLIGYWFSYRAVHHAFASWGIRKTRRGAIPITIEPMPELDAPIELDAEGKPRHVALDGTLARLEEHLLRSRWLRWSRRVEDIQTCVVDRSTAPGAETTDDAASEL